MEAFAAWRRFFEALAEDGPTVLVFEDIHWAPRGPPGPDPPRDRGSGCGPVGRPPRSRRAPDGWVPRWTRSTRDPWGRSGRPNAPRHRHLLRRAYRRRSTGRRPGSSRRRSTDVDVQETGRQFHGAAARGLDGRPGDDQREAQPDEQAQPDEERPRTAEGAERAATPGPRRDPRDEQDELDRDDREQRPAEQDERGFGQLGVTRYQWPRIIAANTPPVAAASRRQLDDEEDDPDRPARPSRSRRPRWPPDRRRRRGTPAPGPARLGQARPCRRGEHDEGDRATRRGTSKAGSAWTAAPAMAPGSPVSLR